MFRWFYKVKPPEIVKYYKTKVMARARVVKVKDGGLQMEVEGEKYPLPGVPRGHIIFGSLEKLKETMKERIFHTIFEEVEKIYADMPPVENFCPFLQDLWRVATMLEDAEIHEDMKLRIRNMKKAFIFFMQEDDSYRFRVQWVLERLNLKKCRLSKADKYYFRAKYFKCDYKDPKNIINQARNDVLY